MTTRDLIEVSAKPIILSLLTEGDSYGYQILLRVRLVSGGTLKWSTEMLTPILQNMEKEGLIRSTWKAAQDGPSRLSFRLTEKGRRECASERERWYDVRDALDRFWDRADYVSLSSIPTC